jgi:hypothetical protein
VPHQTLEQKLDQDTWHLLRCALLLCCTLQQKGHTLLLLRCTLLLLGCILLLLRCTLWLCCTLCCTLQQKGCTLCCTLLFGCVLQQKGCTLLLWANVLVLRCPLILHCEPLYGCVLQQQGCTLPGSLALTLTAWAAAAWSRVCC